MIYLEKFWKGRRASEFEACTINPNYDLGTDIHANNNCKYGRCKLVVKVTIMLLSATLYRIHLLGMLTLFRKITHKQQ
jgi:hypothetical protein